MGLLTACFCCHSNSSDVSCGTDGWEHPWGCPCTTKAWVYGSSRKQPHPRPFLLGTQLEDEGLLTLYLPSLVGCVHGLSVMIKPKGSTFPGLPVSGIMVEIYFRQVPMQ